MSQDGKIVSLFEGSPMPPEMASKAVVERLEHLLERARRGEVLSIAYVGQTANGQCCSGWEAGSSALWWMVGACHWLQHRILGVPDDTMITPS